MPSSRSKKWLDKALRSKRGWRTRELVAMYKSFDFVEVKGAGKGSHRIFEHSVHKHLRTTIPRSSDLHPDYITQAIELIAELRELED